MAVLGSLGVLGAAGGLFSYNRQNFMFDKEQQLKREYQGQDMRIKQFELYREDIRDLVELTVGKMDNYLIVNTLQLCFCVILFTEGKPHPGKWPQRLHWLYSTCNVGAFTYFLLSVWLAMHASIAAHSFGVRLLTQVVRLPVPNKSQLDAARAKAEDYESLGVSNMLRLPVWKKQLQRMMRAMDRVTQEDGTNSEVASEVAESDVAAGGFDGPPINNLHHVQLYRELQANWQSYDAYARVCMSMGTNQLLHALGYYCLGMLVAENRAPWPGLCCVVVFTVLAWLLMRLDLYLTRRLLSIAALLIVAAPILTMITITVDISKASPAVKDAVSCLVPLVFALHVSWIVFIIRIAKADTVNGVALPTQFRAVTYLDVFGWLGQTSRQGPGDNDANDDWRHETEEPGRRNGNLSVVLEEQQETPSNEDTVPSVPQPSASSSQPLLLGTDAPQQGAASSGGTRTNTVRFEDETGGFGRQVSGSSACSSVRRRGQNTAQMRVALINACRKLKERLYEDFQHWEDERVRQLLASDPFTLQAIAQLRERFDLVCGNLELAEGEHSGVDLGVTSSSGSFDEWGGKRRSSSACSTSSLLATDGQPVWLQLEWAANGRCMELFFSCDTGDTSFTRPEDPARISNTIQLEKRLRQFSDKVCALADFVVEQSAETSMMQATSSTSTGVAQGLPSRAPRSPDASDVAAAASDRPRQGLTGRLPRAPDLDAAAVASAPEREMHQRGPLTLQTSQGVRNESRLGEVLRDGVEALVTEQPEDESRAQELRFGGSEAVQLREHTGMKDTFFAAGFQTGSTFYPQQPSMYGRRDHVGPTRRQPGQMPWQTFLQGSIVLTSIWAIGVCWSIFHIFDYDIPLRPSKDGSDKAWAGNEDLMVDTDASLAPDLKRTLLEAKKLPRRPQLVYQGDWPHPFFSPRGLACHPSAGSDTLLIAEKYSVHELRLGTADEASSLQPALTQCLAEAPEFQASGIQGVSLECTPGEKRQCRAVLLGAAGQGALRCNFSRPLQDSRALQSSDVVAEVEITAPAAMSSQRIIVHGSRKWRSLAAGSSDSFWALADGALVHMRPRGEVSTGALPEQPRPLSAELVPQLEVPHATATKSTQVHVLAGSADTSAGASIHLEDGHKGVLLTLESNGLLRAFPLEGGAPTTWWLPAEHVVRWAGVCATGGKLYFAGVTRTPERTASIWSIGLSALSRNLKHIEQLAS